MTTNTTPAEDDASHDRTVPTTDGDRDGDPHTNPVASDARTAVETDVPSGASVHRCAYCDRPFAEESYLILHRGLAHADVLSETEREAFADAYAEEEADLGRFRIVALGLLVLLYFGFLFTFAVVT
ncbi:DUF7410 domain-containing protein [Salinigranum salinum]|uniref:DUF7410 domain-containing protein n=1 Tax=Salinigranum salinum TaxID=1364937 RepID=UPI00195F0BB7|nr:hypothetical protein [Salinigranum salinum]